MIYAVVNTKGGVGKTTIAVHLATMLARLGKTLLIDGDPQASSASWAAWRRDNPGHGPSPTTTCLAVSMSCTATRRSALNSLHVSCPTKH